MVKRSAPVSSTSGQQIIQSPSSSPISSPLQSESESEHRPQTKRSRAKKSKPNSSADSTEKEKQKRATSITITNEIKTMMIEQAMDLAYRQLPFEEIGTQTGVPASRLKDQFKKGRFNIRRGALEIYTKPAGNNDK